jgi:AAA domain
LQNELVMATSPTPRDARSLLIAWANDQDGWVRAITGEAVLSRTELSTAAVERVTESLLVEKQLAAGELLDTPVLGDPGADDAESQALRLVSLRDCQGVNALSKNQAIEFNPRLTILFGENAAGKTGYVRVLKRLANVRSAEEIIPDIHRATAPPQPQAVLTYSVDDQEQPPLEWTGETGVPPLTRLSVFDTPAVALHLDENLTYVYTPPDLALFRYVHSAIEAVRARLEERKAEKEPRNNPFLTAFARDSTVYPKIEQLGPSADMAEIEQLATLSEGERDEIEALKLSMQSLGSETTAGRTEPLRNRIAALRALADVVSAASAFDAAALAMATDELEQAQKAQAKAATSVLGEEDLPEEIRPAWQSFIEAGERYLQASTGKGPYPEAEDDCIYCRQPLEQSAVSLLRAYREYASGTAATAVEAAGARVAKARESLLADDIQQAGSKLNALLPSIEDSDDPPAWATEGHALADAVTAARASFTEEPASPPRIEVQEGLADRVQAALTEAETALRAAEGDASTRKARLAEQRGRLATLEARSTLARLLPEVRPYVENAIWTSKLQAVLRRFQGLLRSLTEASKQASNEVLNESFRKAFEEECRVLRAPTVKLGFPGRRGEAARSKTVSADHSLTEVLSEGEQKVVAIADFLAEASFRGGSAPLVFDDPVNSLDYRRLGEIVSRIVELSEEHQIVVLTHNIWFASELLARFDQSPEYCAFYQVLERDGAKGVIVGGVHPRIDTQGEIKKRINKAITDAETASDSQRAEIVERGYEHIRAWCEQVAEKDLLADVARRYQPNIAMQNLERIKLDKLSAAIDAILPIYLRACRYIGGHSQPMETLDVRPTLEQLKDDWKTLQDARKSYLD